MRRALLTGLPLALTLAAGCQGGNPAEPAAGPSAAPPELSGAVASDGAFAQAALGALRVSIDPATLTATAEPVAHRAATGQGDNFHLSIRPFLGRGDLSVTRVSRDPSGGLNVGVRLEHPFPAPADLNPPATATKRVDLHIFDVAGILVADGADSYFDGQVITNAGIMREVHGYRNPGVLFDKTALGVPANGANTFPYNIFSNGIDVGSDRQSQGNYNPANNGWQGPDLITPVGFDVFPQGGAAEVEYRLAEPPVGSPVTFTIVVTAKYQDPRSAGNGRNKRLPTGNPLDLRYLLPEGSGDLQRIEASVSGDLRDDQSTDVAGITARILDWDHDAPVANPWPDNTDTSKVRESSAIVNMEADFPDLRTSAVTGTAIAPVPGLPVMWETTFAVTNDLLFNAEAGGSRVRGLIKVEDAQDADDSSPTGIKPFVLAEGSTVPVAGATLSSTRYQVVEVLVNDFNGNTPPAAATFAFPGTAPVNSPFSIDLDTASPPLASLDPDGLSLFEVDWQNDGTFDDSIMATVPGADFTHTYTTANPNQQYRIRITDAFNPVSGRLSTLYGPFTVNVTTALNPTVGPDGPVNTGQSGSTISFQYDRFMRPVAADSNGNVYVTYRWNGTGLPFSVVRSADGGNTWGTPVTLTGWASSNGGSLAMTANGKLALAAITGGSSGAVGPLGFARLSNSGTNDLVLETQNSIEATAQWRDPVIATSPTDPDKAWVVANLDSPTDDLLTIWTVNSMSGTPAFGNAGTVDPVSDTGNIFDPHAALGSMNSLHITWTAQTTSTMPGLFYRRFDVATSSFPGAEERVSLATQTNTTIHGVLAVGNDGDPVVVYDEQSNTASTSDIYVTRRASGTWTVPAQVTTGTGAQTAPFLSKDSAGRLVVIWRDNRTGTTDADIWGRVLGADLSPLTPEVALVQDAVNTLHPRIVYNAQNNTHVIVYSDSTSPAPAAPLVRRRILSY